jgi:hypothetical protein
MSTTISTRIDDARGVLWVKGNPAELIEHLLDEAHSDLDPADLAELLSAVRTVIAPLRRGMALAVTPAVPRFPDGAAASPIRRYLTPVRVAATLSAFTLAPGEGGPPAAHARIDAYIDEVAARPRGAAVVRRPA